MYLVAGCNPAARGIIWNGVGSIPVGATKPPIGGWIVTTHNPMQGK